MKIEQFQKLAEQIKSNEIYDIFDYRKMDNLIVSTTQLKGGKNTTGHSHEEADEVYVCLDGYNGEIQVDDNIFDFSKGDFVIIRRGSFHKVFNRHETDELTFLCIFEKYGDRK